MKLRLNDVAVYETREFQKAGYPVERKRGWWWSEPHCRAENVCLGPNREFAQEIYETCFSLGPKIKWVR